MTRALRQVALALLLAAVIVAVLLFVAAYA